MLTEHEIFLLRRARRGRRIFASRKHELDMKHKKLDYEKGGEFKAPRRSKPKYQKFHVTNETI